MNVFNGTTTSFITHIPAVDIAASITADEVINRFKKACDVQERDYQPMSEAEVSEAVSILKEYFTAFSSDETITISAKMILVDGKISFDIDFHDILEKIISVKGWKSYHGLIEGYYFNVKNNNNLIKISYKEDRKGYKYEDTLVSSDETEVALYKTVIKLLYGRE